MNTNRRELIVGTLLATGVGTFGVSAFAAEPGKLSEADYKRLSAAPKAVADHTVLAKHYRALIAEHEAEAKAFESLAAQYAKGVGGANATHARELSRAAKHVAGHSRDFAEALSEIAEVHEGIAQGPV
jgi:hypothetical protein